MLTSLKNLIELISPRDRRNGLVLLFMMLVSAALEVIGVAAVPAFVSAFLAPEHLSGFPIIGEFASALPTGPGLVIWGGLALIVIFALKNAFLILNFYFQGKYAASRRVDLGRRLMNAYMRAPYSFHISRNTSELLRNIDREASVIANQAIAALLEIATRVVILIGVLTLLFVVEPLITLYWIGVFGLIAAVGVKAVSSKLKAFGLEEQRQRKVFVQALYQGFGAIKEARILGREQHFSDQVHHSVEKMARVNRHKRFISKVIAPTTEFFAITGLLVLAAGLVIAGRPTESILVTLSLFVVGLVRLRETANALMNHLANLRYNIVAVDPVYRDLKRLEPLAKAPRRRPERQSRSHLRRQIELRDVTYEYEGAAAPSLRGITLTIPVGCAVGFVGSTGAGKSTLIDVMLGLLEPQKGGVWIDGTDIREAGIGAWQNSIGYIPQTICLLDDTIRRNIALGVPDDQIDEGALWAAVRTAQLEEFVERQPEGLDTVIGERGVRISGGERQRIGIARALYDDPDVLIMDEATSSLDNATERAIIQAVEAAKGRRTIIMIAHRLSTVKNCDVLYFLKDGRIDGAGSFAELEDQHDDFRLMSSG